MIKKTISYVDFNGNKQTEDFYFHISSPEATRINNEFGVDGIEKGIQKMVQSNDIKQMVDFLERTILGAYGQKTQDGKSFLKDPEERKRFEYSQAYAELFEELFQDADKMSKFIAGATGAVKQEPYRNPDKIQQLHNPSEPEVE